MREREFVWWWQSECLHWKSSFAISSSFFFHLYAGVELMVINVKQSEMARFLHFSEMEKKSLQKKKTCQHRQFKLQFIVSASFSFVPYIRFIFNAAVRYRSFLPVHRCRRRRLHHRRCCRWCRYCHSKLAIRAHSQNINVYSKWEARERFNANLSTLWNLWIIHVLMFCVRVDIDVVTSNVRDFHPLCRILTRYDIFCNAVSQTEWINQWKKARRINVKSEVNNDSNEREKKKLAIVIPYTPHWMGGGYGVFMLEKK